LYHLSFPRLGFDSIGNVLSYHHLVDDILLEWVLLCGKPDGDIKADAYADATRVDMRTSKGEAKPDPKAQAKTDAKSDAISGKKNNSCKEGSPNANALVETPTEATRQVASTLRVTPSTILSHLSQLTNKPVAEVAPKVGFLAALLDGEKARNSKKKSNDTSPNATSKTQPTASPPFDLASIGPLLATLAPHAGARKSMGALIATVAARKFTVKPTDPTYIISTPNATSSATMTATTTAAITTPDAAPCPMANGNATATTNGTGNGNATATANGTGNGNATATANATAARMIPTPPVTDEYPAYDGSDVDDPAYDSYVDQQRIVQPHPFAQPHSFAHPYPKQWQQPVGPESVAPAPAVSSALAALFSKKQVLDNWITLGHSIFDQFDKSDRPIVIAELNKLLHRFAR
jgi:hypothetical protein